MEAIEKRYELSLLLISKLELENSKLKELLKTKDEQLNIFKNYIGIKNKRKYKEATELDKLLHSSLKNLKDKFNSRIFNKTVIDSLNVNSIFTVGDLLSNCLTEEDLLKYNGIGDICIHNFKKILDKYGLELGDPIIFSFYVKENTQEN